MKRMSAINIVLFLVMALFTVNSDAVLIDSARSDVSGIVAYAPDRIVVKFDPSVMSMMDKKAFKYGKTGVPALDELGMKHGVSSIRPQFPGAKKKLYKGNVVDLSDWHKLKFSNKADVLSAVEDYRKISGIIEVQPVSIHKVYRTPLEHVYDQQWHLPKIGAPQAWDIETGNPNIIVAVLDTGVRYFHKDLGGANASLNFPTYADGNMWINLAEKNGISNVDDDGNGKVDDWIGWDFVVTTLDDGAFIYCWPGEDCSGADNDPRDFNGHGTHCAGNVAAMNDNGYAAASIAGGWCNETFATSGNGVKVMPLRIGWSSAYVFLEVGMVAMDYAAEALYYAANKGARIASCSWGSENTGGIGAAIDYFLAHDGLIFKAAGNDYDESFDYMGGRNDIIKVAATDQNDCKADFSSYGTWINISAPGVYIWSLYHVHDYPADDYVAYLDGTSMAAPLAASVAALIWSQNPDLSAEQVKQKLYGSADNIYSLSCNSLYAGKLGVGRINAFRAVSSGSPPVANFSGTPTGGYKPLIVQFTDLSTGSIASRSWNFGDGSTSTETSPLHTYNAAGTYTVSLTVTGSGGADTETKTNYIQVTEAIGVDRLETGRYQTAGKGSSRTTSYIQATNFIQGDAVIIRAYVKDTATNLLIANAIVNIAITGPMDVNLTTRPSDAGGMAEAKWQTTKPTKRGGGGTPKGTYTATTRNVTASGYTWDGLGTNTTFTIQ